MRRNDHPTVREFYEKDAAAVPAGPPLVEADWLRRLAREAGADDVGVVRDRASGAG